MIGANDIVNPLADDPGSSISGMPILRPWLAKTVFVVKRGQGTGFSGEANPLFTQDRTFLLYGDAKEVAKRLIQEVKALDGPGMS